MSRPQAGRGHALGGLVLAALVLAACGADAPHAAGTPRKRQVTLEGEPNFRDLGGYVATDGRSVKWGQIFRSGELSRLTEADVATLGALRLKTVANFLTPEEIEAHGPDRLPDGVREILLPIEGEQVGRLSRETQVAIKTGDFASIPPSQNPIFHRLLLDDGTAEYAAVLRAAMDPTKRPLAFHCSHGIHRTGTATALLLSALGVPWDTIREDYVLSNQYRAEEIERQLERIRQGTAKARGVSRDEVDMTNVEAFFVVRPAYIDGTLARAVEEHGSIDAYIRDGLGITVDEIERLRAELLE